MICRWRNWRSTTIHLPKAFVMGPIIGMKHCICSQLSPSFFFLSEISTIRFPTAHRHLPMIMAMLWQLITMAIATKINKPTRKRDIIDWPFVFVYLHSSLPCPCLCVAGVFCLFSLSFFSCSNKLFSRKFWYPQTRHSSMPRMFILFY